MKVQCPACGFQEAVQSMESNMYPNRVHGPFIVDEEIIRCPECEEMSFASDEARNAYVYAKYKHEKRNK